MLAKPSHSLTGTVLSHTVLGIRIFAKELWRGRFQGRRIFQGGRNAAILCAVLVILLCSTFTSLLSDLIMLFVACIFVPQVNRAIKEKTGVRISKSFRGTTDHNTIEARRKLNN